MASENPFLAFPRPTKAYHTKGYAATSPTRPELQLTGKTVLITGGASGIGYGISTAFAQAGVSTLAIMSRSAGPLAEAKEELQEAHPATTVVTFAVSMSDAAGVSAALAELGAIDVLVLSAGASHAMAPLLDVPAAAVQLNFEANVLGPLNVLRAFAALPPRAPGAERTVVHVSTSGAYHPMPGTSVYGASKAAMTYLMSSLAAEYGDKGIRTFMYHPAVAFTDMARGMGFQDGMVPWDDVSLPGQQAVWFCSPEADFLKGRFVWSHWDVEELQAKKQIIEENPRELTISLIMDKVLG